MATTRKLFPLFIFLLWSGLSVNVSAGPVCGDGAIDAPETCDSSNAMTCTGDCRAAESTDPCTCCGDGNVDVDSGEQCDPDNETLPTATCDMTCQFIPIGLGQEQYVAECAGCHDAGTFDMSGSSSGDIAGATIISDLASIDGLMDSVSPLTPQEVINLQNFLDSVTLPTTTTTTTAAPTTTTTTAAPTTTTTTGATTTTTTGATTTTTTGATTTTTTGATTTTTTGATTTTTTGATTSTTAPATTTTTAPSGSTTTGATTTTTTGATTTTTTGASTTTTTLPSPDTATVALPGGAGDLTITTETGETLSDVSAAAAVGGPSGISFPFGVISYTSTVPNGVNNVTTRLSFPADLPSPLDLYKVDLGGVYTILPTTVWTLVDPRTVDVTLIDGGPFDLDNMADGKVVDPIAPGGGGGGGAAGGTTGNGIFGCTLNTTASNDPTLPLLMLLSVTYLYRRRTRKVALKRD